MLSVIINDNSSGYIRCYTEGSAGSGSENRNYAIAASLIDSAKNEKSKVKITGNKIDDYFQIKHIEVQGHIIEFE